MTRVPKRHPAKAPVPPHTNEFDVCLSFAGPDRHFVGRVATALTKAGLSVFYDEFELTTSWGKDLFSYLYEVYSKRARLCVTFFSRAYYERAWTRHELRAAQARVLHERREYLLPVCLNGVKPPAEFASTGYLTSTGRNAPKLADAILAKFEGHLHATGYVNQDEFLALLRHGLSQDMTVNTLMEGITAARTKDLRLTRALLLLIFLTQESADAATKSLMSHFLGAFPPLASRFDTSHRVRVHPDRAGFMFRHLDTEGHFTLLMPEAFWAPRLKLLNRRIAKGLTSAPLTPDYSLVSQTRSSPPTRTSRARPRRH